MSDILFSPEFFRCLEGVRLKLSKSQRDRAGEQLSRSESGEGIEFHDFRGYAPGDDLRYVDWNAYARFGKIYLKRFRKEQSSRVSILLDLSGSMDFGDPSKRAMACRVAASTGIVSLATGVRVRFFSSGSSEAQSFEGKQSVPLMLDHLIRLHDAKLSEASFREFLRQDFKFEREELFLISDLLDGDGPDPVFESMKSWRAAGNDCRLIQVLSEEERSPAWQGRATVVDRETGERLQATFADPERELYTQIVTQFLDQVERFCARLGVDYARVISEQDLEQSLSQALRLTQ